MMEPSSIAVNRATIRPKRTAISNHTRWCTVETRPSAALGAPIPTRASGLLSNTGRGTTRMSPSRLIRWLISKKLPSGEADSKSRCHKWTKTCFTIFYSGDIGNRKEGLKKENIFVVNLDEVKDPSRDVFLIESYLQYIFCNFHFFRIRTTES